MFLAQPPGVVRFLLGCPPNVVSSSVSLQSARPWGAPLITWRTGFHSFVVNYNRLLSVTKSLRGSSRCKVLSYCYLMSCGGPRTIGSNPTRPTTIIRPSSMFWKHIIDDRHPYRESTNVPTTNTATTLCIKGPPNLRIKHRLFLTL